MQTAISKDGRYRIMRLDNGLYLIRDFALSWAATYDQSGLKRHGSANVPKNVVNELLFKIRAIGG